MATAESSWIWLKHTIQKLSLPWSAFFRDSPIVCKPNRSARKDAEIWNPKTSLSLSLSCPNWITKFKQKSLEKQNKKSQSGEPFRSELFRSAARLTDGSPKAHRWLIDGPPPNWQFTWSVDWINIDGGIHLCEFTMWNGFKSMCSKWWAAWQPATAPLLTGEESEVKHLRGTRK